MKKTYKKPETLITVIDHQYHLLADSNTETTRLVEGDPTSNGLPTDIGETSEGTDTYAGHGQGTGGGGNRSKEAFDLWDDWGW